MMVVRTNTSLFGQPRVFYTSFIRCNSGTFALMVTFWKYDFTFELSMNPLRSKIP
jgi:hypothetical protein